jgi:hypothetical protein
MITHEHARDLQVIDVYSVPGNVDFYYVASADLAYVEGNPYTDDVGRWTLTPFGRQALAEYEAAHVTLTKEQLGEVFKAGYRHGLDDGIGGPYEESERWRLSNIWDNLQAEKA